MTTAELETICKGNKDAIRFLEVFLNHAHMLDDIIDRDKDVTAETLIKQECGWIIELAGNAWFLQHRQFYVSLIVTALNSWLDSNGMAASADVRVKRASDVVKGQYHEVVWFTAFLCGGWEHLRAMSGANRAYDYDVKE